MSVKMKGAEFNAYYHDDEYWVNGAWHDDHCIKVNGEYREDVDADIPDDADVVIESGVVYVPVEGGSGAEENEVQLVSHFKKWRKQRNFSFIVVTVEKDKVADVRQALRSIPGVTEVKGG
ncbi:hypothetical phage protein [Shigella phage Ag3]|uniref:Hypothetical phage protein n=1 Tax=Shigella phage Ag3 TaxID=637730 RepID=C8XUN3_9CAUD|nr:hypothetical protein phiSboM-AG3_gp129 [Shigella phage Ag3]ACO94363.1 hypothetical phage protein [Shigella phage Ag3]